MYKIFDYNDEFTGFEFNFMEEAQEHLEFCPEGYYFESVWDYDFKSAPAYELNEIDLY